MLYILPNLANSSNHIVDDPRFAPKRQPSRIRLDKPRCLKSQRSQSCLITRFIPTPVYTFPGILLDPGAVVCKIQYARSYKPYQQIIHGSHVVWPFRSAASVKEPTMLPCNSSAATHSVSGVMEDEHRPLSGMVRSGDSPISPDAQIRRPIASLSAAEC